MMERSVTRSLRCVNSLACFRCVVGREFGRTDSGHAITDLSGHSGLGYDRGVVAMGLGCGVLCDAGGVFCGAGSGA